MIDRVGGALNVKFMQDKVDLPLGFNLRPYAIAAIEAMSEPTQEMLEAGLMAGTNLTTGQPSARLAARTAGERMADQWRAMIDAALGKLK